MRTWPTDPNCYLIELSDLFQNPLLPPVQENIPALMQIVHWAESYLCHPHAELGREGPVCPFVPTSLQSQLFFLAVKRGKNCTQDDVYKTVMQYRDWFLQIEPHRGRQARFKTILILFPDITLEDAPFIIDETQRRLKPEFVAEGLMIGQFHPLPPSDEGLWNPNFRPLHSPIPLLAIRHMVESDLPFLVKERHFVTSYLNVHGNTVPKRQQTLFNELALKYKIDRLEDEPGA